MVPPFHHGEALESYEALAIEEFVAHGLKETGETRKLEVVLMLCQISLSTRLPWKTTFDIPVKGIAASLNVSAA